MIQDIDPVTLDALIPSASGLKNYLLFLAPYAAASVATTMAGGVLLFRGIEREAIRRELKPLYERGAIPERPTIFNAYRLRDANKELLEDSNSCSASNP